ncbi:competence protein ComEA [Prauserella muralis]|nr:competence protein ComEA [Prauserella muralis]
MRLEQLAARVAREEGGAGRPDAAPGPAGRLVERWLPQGPATGSPSRRRRFAVVAVLLGVAAVAGLTAWLTGGRPEPERPPPLPVAHASPAPANDSGAEPSTAADAEPLVVSVVGKVAEPGLVTVPPGSRVADAIDAAGGARRGADLLTVNLARRLSDGEQLYVGIPAPPGMQAPGAPTAAGATSGEPGAELVDLNAADQAQLEELSGVGEVTAQRILDWRAEHGRFTAVEQLREIDGIGEKRFEQLRDQVSVR